MGKPRYRVRCENGVWKYRWESCNFGLVLWLDFPIPTFGTVGLPAGKNLILFL